MSKQQAEMQRSEKALERVAIEAMRLALAPRQLRRSLIVMVIVGSVLNLINQPEAFSGEAEVNFLRLGLTYSVPFCVFTFGAWSAHFSRLRNARN